MQPDRANLLYLKLGLFELTEFIVCNKSPKIMIILKKVNLGLYLKYRTVFLAAGASCTVYTEDSRRLNGTVHKINDPSLLTKNYL